MKRKRNRQRNEQHGKLGTKVFPPHRCEVHGVLTEFRLALESPGRLGMSIMVDLRETYPPNFYHDVTEFAKYLMEGTASEMGAENPVVIHQPPPDYSPPARPDETP